MTEMHEKTSYCPHEGAWPFAMHPKNVEPDIESVVAAISTEARKLLGRLPSNTSLGMSFYADHINESEYGPEAFAVSGVGWTVDITLRPENPINDFRDRSNAMYERLTLMLHQEELRED